jgi:hypothetical protein
VRRKALREAREDESINKTTTLKKVSVETPTLDDLGKERTLPNTKQRNIDGVLVQPKRQPSNNLLSDTQTTSESDYQESLLETDKPAHKKKQQRNIRLKRNKSKK